jgi:hypothetical protein
MPPVSLTQASTEAADYEGANLSAQGNPAGEIIAYYRVPYCSLYYKDKANC